jgi:iron complex transport system substrate-binding protein
MFFYNFIKKNYLKTLILTGFISFTFSTTSRFLWKKPDSPCPDSNGIKAERVVSTSMASDEILFQILDQAGQLQRLAAVSHFADSPEYSHIAGKVHHSVARVGENVEMLASLKPDLIIYSTFNRPDLVSGLKGISARKCRLENFESLSDISDNILKIGLASGFVGESEKLAKAFATGIQRNNTATVSLAGVNLVKISSRAPAQSKPRVLSFDGSGSVMGAKTTFDDLVSLAGGVNAAAEAGLSGWPTVNVESIQSMAPDVIVLLSDQSQTPALRARLAELPGWRDTPAVRNQRFAAPKPADLLALSPFILEALPELRAGIDLASGDSDARATDKPIKETEQ